MRNQPIDRLTAPAPSDEMARLDYRKPSAAADRKPKRYRLVVDRVEAHGARVKRIRLAQMDALTVALDTRSKPTA
jgi:hypothetical protein